MEQATRERIVVNCDEAPSIPYGSWSILPESEQLQNRVRGQHELDMTKVVLHLVERQKDAGRIRGNLLREELSKLSDKITVLPANFLDFLLKGENQYLIPESWRGKDIFFWGTIYQDAGSTVYVRCLQWNDRHWEESYRWFGFDWREYGPSAVLEKVSSQS